MSGPGASDPELRGLGDVTDLVDPVTAETFSGGWVARSSALLLAVTVTVAVLGLFQGVTISRLLGPTGKGEVFLGVLTATSVAQLLECSLGSGLQYFATRGDITIARGVRLAVWFAFVGGAAALAVMALLLVAFRGSVPDSLGSAGVLAGAAIVPAEMISLSLAPLFLAADQVRTGAVVDVVRAGLSVVLVVVAVVAFDGGSAAALGSVAAASLVASALSVVLLLRVRSPEPTVARVHVATRAVLGFGFKQHLGSVLARITKRADSWVLLALSGPAAVGVYSVASGLAELPMMLPRSLRGTAASFTASRDPKEAAVGAAQLSRSALFVSTVGNVAFAVVGVALLPLVYGQDFAAARGPFVILLLSTTALGGYVVLGGYLSGAGHPQLLTIVLLVPALANVALSFALIPSFGLTGNAWASAVTSIAVMVSAVVAFRRVSGVPGRDAVVPRVADLRRAGQLLRR